MNRDKEQEKKRRRGKEAVVYSEPKYSADVMPQNAGKKAYKNTNTEIDVIEEDHDFETIDVITGE